MFSSLNFITTLNSNDKVLRIKNTNGLVVHIIKDPSCTTKHDGVNIYIKQQSESTLLTLNFLTNDDAKLAHIILRDNLKQLSINLGINYNPGPGPIIPNNNCQCEECDPKRHVVLLSDIWTESNLIPNIAPNISSGIVQKITDLSLTWINGSTKFNNINFVDIIPGYYGDGISYSYVLKTYNDIIIPQGWQNWKLDLDCGTICFKDGFVSTGSIIVDSTHPPKISFYKYIGNKGIFSGSSNNLSIAFFPPLTTSGIDHNFNVPVAIQNIIAFYINGQYIDNTIVPQWILNSSTTSPTTITWLGTADMILEPDDIVTIIYN